MLRATETRARANARPPAQQRERCAACAGGGRPAPRQHQRRRHRRRQPQAHPRCVLRLSPCFTRCTSVLIEDQIHGGTHKLNQCYLFYEFVGVF